MDYIDVIRKLARSTYYQNIYSAAKDVGSIQLFENKNNYSGLQSLFLYWLKVYDLLYTELSQKEWKYLDEDVINDDCRCDAFLYWRGKQIEFELDKNKQEQKANNLKFKNPGKVSNFDIDLRGGN
jgi:hypothetical protein